MYSSAAWRIALLIGKRREEEQIVEGFECLGYHHKLVYLDHMHILNEEDKVNE
jgi:hypothetical protein